jgi:hypothetical protein
MAGKEYLKSIREQEFKLRTLEDAILNLETKSTKVTSSWKDSPVQGGVNEGMAGIVVKLIETQQKYIKAWDKLIDDRNEAYDMICSMDNTTNATVLWLYYIRCYTWEQVAVSMSYSISYIFTLHGLALAEFKRVYEDRIK